MDPFTVLILVLQRVVEGVGVAVVALGEAWGLDVWVGAEEAAGDGVVKARVYVHQAVPGEMLVACVAPPEVELRLRAKGYGSSVRGLRIRPQGS